MNVQYGPSLAYKNEANYLHNKYILPYRMINKVVWNNIESLIIANFSASMSIIFCTVDYKILYYYMIAIFLLYDISVFLNEPNYGSSPSHLFYTWNQA